MRPLATLQAALLGLALAGPALAQPTTQTLSGVVTGTRTLSASEVYLLDGEVYVDNGAVLNIPAGTIIKGKQTPSTGRGKASVLVVQRGGTLNATGTSTAPIIFTSESDNVADPFDTNEAQRGLWGGVVILGNATNNRGIRTIEGIDPTDRTRYGCGDAGFACDEDDNSGKIQYVSIRHAGFTLEPNAEINGLTFGAVGRGTLVEYVEVFANSDDSFEWFGGNVNAKYLIGAFGGDDDLDWDTGYTGKLQFVFSIKDESGDVGRCIEGDGAASPFTATPLSSPIVSNLTCIGSGVGSTPGGSDAGGPTLKLRENTGGFIYNSVFTAYQSTAAGIDLETQPTDDNGNPLGATDGTVSTRQNFDDGQLDIRNNLFFDFSVGNTVQAIVRRDDPTLEAAIAARNQFVAPGLVSISRQQDRGLDPRPGANAPAASGADFTLAGLDAFFTPVSFRGAFGTTTPIWATGWTALDKAFYLSSFSTPVEEGVAAAFELTVGPNPARGQATVRFSLDRAQAVTVAVYDVLGRQVAALAEGSFGAGPQAVALSTSALPTGLYVVRLTAEGGQLSRTITVAR